MEGRNIRERDMGTMVGYTRMLDKEKGFVVGERGENTNTVLAEGRVVAVGKGGGKQRCFKGREVVLGGERTQRDKVLATPPTAYEIQNPGVFYSSARYLRV